MRPWCQVGSTRRCQRCGPGSSPGGRSRWGSWWPGWWLASTRAGFDSPGLHSVRQRIPEGVPCRGRNRRVALHRSAVDRRHTLSDAPGGAARLSPGWGGFDSRRERLLVVAQRIEHHPATVGDGGSNPPGEIRRRRAGWAGAALIWRSSVVRFHGRRSPRSSAEEQRASTPRAQVRALPGSSEVTGRRGAGPPHRLRASEIAGSNPADQILALSRESDAR